MYRTPPKYRKIEHLLENDVPTQTEIRSYLGVSLAQIFNDYSNEETRKLLGIVPPLKGPVLKDLWISPSDQLIGKVALKPPLTNKYTKACTHQGILDIGESAVLKFEEVTEEKIRKIFQTKAAEERKMFEAEKRHAVELSVRETRDEYEKIIESLNKDFKKKLKRALDDATKKSKRQMQEAIIEERINVETRMMNKLREEIGRVVVSLNDEFQQSFRAQRDNMVADFNSIMRQERKKFDAKVESYDRKKTQDISAQCPEFEIRNNAETAIILCSEIMPCETQEMRQSCQRQIEAMQTLLLDSAKSMQEEVPKDEKNDGNNKNVNPDEREFFQVVEIIDKDGKLWRPVQLMPDIPQIDCTVRESNFPIVSSEINFFPTDRYTDRIISESSIPSLRSQDSLPFCYLEDRLYVRSDYREKPNDEKEIIINEEMKTMKELTVDARFIMELKRTKSCLKKEEKNPRKSGE